MGRALLRVGSWPLVRLVLLSNCYPSLREQNVSRMRESLKGLKLVGVICVHVRVLYDAGHVVDRHESYSVVCQLIVGRQTNGHNDHNAFNHYLKGLRGMKEIWI